MGFISEISLQNFRNYSSLKLSFKAGLNVFLGENGHGKTNLLEAVYFLSLLRSFRCKNIQNLKQWKNDSFALNCILNHEESLPDRLHIDYGEKRSLKINGNAISRSSEFIRRVNAVSFTPEDIELVKGSAGNRRQYLDILLSQLSPAYLNCLQNYNKALKARNKLLRQVSESEVYDSALIKTYDGLLIEHGSNLTMARSQILTRLEDKIRHFNSSMFPEGKKMKVVYSSTVTRKIESEEAVRAAFERKLSENFEKDITRSVTHSGPHRDDLLILLNGKSLSSFGSEGQCRLASLVMKMSAAEQLIEDKNTDNVILLIDDVLGELDNQRKSAFLETIMRGDQIFIACTEVPGFCQSREHSVYHIKNGEVTSEEQAPQNRHQT